MKLKLMMFIKIYFKKKKLIILITQKNDEFCFDENKKITGKIKFDNNDYPKNSEFFFDKNKKKIGKKNERRRRRYANQRIYWTS